MALNPGDTFFNGHYQILQQLGRSGFGFVYMAEDTLLEKERQILSIIRELHEMVGDGIEATI